MSDIVSEIAEWLAIAKGDKCALCKGTGKIRGGHVTCPKCGGNKAVAKDANESLATVLRHDEDHDNWHRMHGDEPCTSEADCAEKRAKYAEVKAEVAKSADEILAEIEQWRIQKGDVQGHEFHGNQYTERTIHETAARLSHLQDNAFHMYEGAQKGTVTPFRHRSMADMHREEAGRLRQLIASDPGNSGARGAETAAKLHDEAARLHDVAGSFPTVGNTMNAVNGTYAATSGTNAGVTDGGAILSLGEVTDPIHTDQFVKATEIAKGDLPGHAFHGNQYAAGAGTSANAVVNRAEKMFLTDANGPARDTWGGNTTKDFADMKSAHEQIASEHENVANRLKENMKIGKIPTTKWGVAGKAIEAHQKAAEAHRVAAGSWHKSGETGYTGREQGVPTTAFGAYKYSERAGTLTDQANQVSAQL